MIITEQTSSITDRMSKQMEFLANEISHIAKTLKEGGESTPRAIPQELPPFSIHRLTSEYAAPGNGNSTHTKKIRCRHVMSSTS